MKHLKSNYIEWLLAVLLLVLFYTMAVTGRRYKSVTYDEPTHLSTGYVVWRYGDFRFQPENGVLPQRLAAFPTFLDDTIRAPEFSHEAWQKADQYPLARQLFFELGNDALKMQHRGRMVIVGVATLLGLVVFIWGRILYGTWGGLIPLTLFAFSPTFLAHGALTTSDLVVTFFFTASVGAFWWMFHRFHLWSVASSCLTLGGVCISKMSCPLILPMLGGMVVARLVDPRPIGVSWLGKGGIVVRSDLRKMGLLFLALSVSGCVAYGSIWLAYGFRYSAFSPDVPVSGQFSKSWDDVIANEGVMGKACDLLEFARSRKLFPEAYIFGFAYVLEQSRSRQAFINGKYSKHGWWYFFPYCLLVKTPIPVLLTVFFGFVSLLLLSLRGGQCRGILAQTSIRGGAPSSSTRPFPGAPLFKVVAAYRSRLTSLRLWRVLYHTTPLWCLLAVYWAVSVRSHLNIGHRHILPTYPAMFLLAGSVVALPLGRRPLLTAICALLIWHLGASLSIRPHYLAYFNAFAGGPDNGYRHLVDSSLDWGQDLITLRSWLEKNVHTGEKAYLSYQGTGDLDYYRLNVECLPCFGVPWDPRDGMAPQPLKPGIYCISASRLALLFNPFRPAWKEEFEPEFKALTEEMDALRKGGVQDEGASLPDRELIKNIQRYRQMRLAKLCTMLREREPNATAGYSILIYRLSEEDLRRIEPE